MCLNRILSFSATFANCSISSRCLNPSLPNTSYHKYKRQKFLCSGEILSFRIPCVSTMGGVLLYFFFSPKICLISCAASKCRNLLLSGDISFANSYKLGKPSQKEISSIYFRFNPLCFLLSYGSENLDSMAISAYRE